MPDRIPTDDLYARLGVSFDADAAAIDRAWRALLKRHHPDVAGADSLEDAKRINVAHDWLSQPERRARYDAARGRNGARPPWNPRAASARRPRPPRPDPGDGLEDRFGAAAAGIRVLLERVAGLTQDDLDRLTIAERPAVGLEFRPFVPQELWGRVEALDRRIDQRLPPAAREHGRAIAAARAFGHALVLEAFLLLHLPGAELTLEAMRHPWEVAVGQPRYGPNTADVAALIRRTQRATPAEGAALERAWAVAHVGDEPWPAGVLPDDYEALAISAALARRDAAAAAVAARLAAHRDAFARSAHIAALRPIFSAAAYEPLQAVWDGVMQPGRRPARPIPTVRRA